MAMGVRRLNYIGSKHTLMPFLINAFKEFTGNDSLEHLTLADLFTGTAAVSMEARKHKMITVASDTELYSGVIAIANTVCSYSDRVQSLMDHLNSLDGKVGLVSNNYTRAVEQDGRLFFSVENGKRIDAVREEIDRLDLTDEDRHFLIASLLVSADSVANTASVYGAYLKSLKKSALRPFKIEPIHQIREPAEPNSVVSLCCDALTCLENIATPIDIIYLDPPYNQRQYSKNYHVLNYIAEYSPDVEIYGKTGLLTKSSSSAWCSRKTAPLALKAILEESAKHGRFLFLSYNNEGLIPHAVILEEMNKWGRVEVRTQEYRRFKSSSLTEKSATIEYLFCLEFSIPTVYEHDV